MRTFRRRATTVVAVQWWPPEDTRHDAAATPVRWPEAGSMLDRTGCDCADQRECDDDEHKIWDGDIGRTSKNGGSYWVRLCSSQAQKLKPGDWLLRGDPLLNSGYIAVVGERQFARCYEPATEVSHD